MFFENHGKAMAEYIDIRDEDKYSYIKLFIEHLWSIYKPYADRHFKADAKKCHFHERFWEMYLGVTLIKRGYSIHRFGDKGPEFYIDIGSRKMWFEAVAPGRGEGNDAVPESPLGQVTEPPQREILLRLTNAVTEKHKKYELDKKKGIIQDNDLYILAVHVSRIDPENWASLYGVKIPYIVQALYAAGAYINTFNTNTGQIIDSYYEYRDKIPKKSGSPVSTNCFMDNEYCGISAVIYSFADHLNVWNESNLGYDFITVHNFKATNQLQRGFFPFGIEYWVEEQENEIHIDKKNWNTEKG